MGLVTGVGLDAWFADRLQGLNCTPETVAYVVGVLGKRHWDDGDNMSRQSVVLAFNHATFINDFAGFQRIGDWVLFADAVFPETLEQNRLVTVSLGRRAYSRCYQLLKGQWRVYEELADDLPLIAAKVRRKLH